MAADKCCLVLRSDGGALNTRGNNRKNKNNTNMTASTNRDVNGSGAISNGSGGGNYRKVANEESAGSECDSGDDAHAAHGIGVELTRV